MRPRAHQAPECEPLAATEPGDGRPMLLLPAAVAAALEREARRRGLTAPELIARIVEDFVRPRA